MAADVARRCEEPHPIDLDIRRRRATAGLSHLQELNGIGQARMLDGGEHALDRGHRELVKIGDFRGTFPLAGRAANLYRSGLPLGIYLARRSHGHFTLIPLALSI